MKTIKYFSPIIETGQLSKPATTKNYIKVFQFCADFFYPAKCFGKQLTSARTLDHGSVCSSGAHRCDHGPDHPVYSGLLSRDTPLCQITHIQHISPHEFNSRKYY